MRPHFQWRAYSEYYTPPALLEVPEAARRARLIVGFGLVGSIFGPIYATFYLLIGHGWGTAIIMACTLGMAAVPWLLKKTGSLVLTGNLHALILATGFSGLTAIEGGVNGHAIAWLASVPLCALLLVGTRAAQLWCGVCFLVTLLFCVLDARHVITPIFYPARWHAAVTAAGFLGLVVFMSVIGVIFETGRKKTFRQLQEALHDLSHSNTQLLQADAEKSEILGVAAHDLKNPLNEIMGFAKLIVTKKNASMEQVQEDAREILKASTHMHQLVSDLLDMQAIEEGSFVLKKAFFDLAEPTAEVVSDHLPVAARKQIALELESAQEAAVVQADHSAVLQVLNNLISNAIKYSPPGRAIFVRVRVEGADAVAEVQDQGPGISPEDRAHLFKKFARLSARPTAGESSTGLGLSIVKRLMDLMGGTVVCHSAPGQGATFVVRFPSVSLAGKVMDERDAARAGRGGDEMRHRFEPATPIVSG
jgi:signal transduction histidine kinase